ncbi:hypothetical protein ACIP1T_11955 [Pseudomonas japonica]|uniref:hypothetical protein n=1 Tax=Pseudomonas japonica TaxID=256466 RepID=UPI00381CFA81
MIQIDRADTVGFFLISAIVPLIILIYGDYLYIGIWYYLVIPLAAWLIAIWLGSRTGFMSGLAIALALEYILFLQFNWRAEHQEGMVGIVHFFSLPGAVLGMVSCAYLLKRISTSSWLVVLLLSCVSVLIGFTLAQALFYLFSFAVVAVMKLAV